MLTDLDLLAWYTKLGLADSARVVIDHIRSSDPARRVDGGRHNVSGFYPSKKMGATIQFESHRVELAAVYELEYDDDVLEYFDQPPSFKLDYDSADGRHMGVLHTADYFVIRNDCAGWEECKTEDELVCLNRKNPNRYARDQKGIWICPPGEAHAVAAGLYYRVRSSRDIDWVYQRNIQFLEDYLRDGFPTAQQPLQAVLAHVGAVPGILLHQLFEATSSAVSRDDIYAMVACGLIHVDLSAAPISEPSRVHVFTNAEAARLSVPLVAFGHGANAGSAVASTPDESRRTDEIWKRLARARERELQTANERLRKVTGLLAGSASSESDSVPGRTLRRWLALYRAAERELGSGYLGLLPRPPRGNATPKLPEEARDLMNEFIITDYESLKQKTRYASWIAFKLACERRGMFVPSFKTFCLAVRSRPGFEQAAKRQGHRAAYAREDFYWELELTTPRHGDRPFEITHIDHTELDIETVCSRTGRVLGRPWLTLLTDAFSRRILALYLTFDPPSYRSCMMVLRECVRRLARLPQIVVVDGGRDFQSIYFETLLARYECIKKTRPAAKPRFGSVCERLFGTANTQFIHNLKGNTQIMRLARQVTQSVNPKGQAVWSLEELHRRLTEYAYEIYDVLHHPALGQTPREACELGIAATGQRLPRVIAYDREFLVHTLPTTRKGTAKITPGRGVKIHNLYYWSDAFRAPDVEKQHVAIRYDPFDAGTAYAFVNKEWTECHSEYFAVFQGRSEKELMLATEELRKSMQHQSGEFSITSRKLAEFLDSVEAEEILLEQRLGDKESRAGKANLAVVPKTSLLAEQSLIRAEDISAGLQTYGSF
ncbi:MAG: Mu transposase C-terminal domain-containing protein [Bryobacteraceae bacterium]